eukprot:1139049-Pelagomonas_calceolata.AAC.8
MKEPPMICGREVTKGFRQLFAKLLQMQAGDVPASIERRHVSLLSGHEPCVILLAALKNGTTA